MTRGNVADELTNRLHYGDLDILCCQSDPHSEVPGHDPMTVGRALR